jgi:hypothetical protein
MWGNSWGKSWGFSWGDYVIVTPSGFKAWDGSSWVLKPLKVWTGSAWEAKQVKRWNGSAWINYPN